MGEDVYKELESLRGFLVNWLVFRNQGFGRQKPMRKGKKETQMENGVYVKQMTKQTRKKKKGHIYFYKNQIEMGEQQ